MTPEKTIGLADETQEPLSIFKLWVRHINPWSSHLFLIILVNIFLLTHFYYDLSKQTYRTENKLSSENVAQVCCFLYDLKKKHRY